jgi:hypothetical protein
MTDKPGLTRCVSAIPTSSGVWTVEVEATVDDCPTCGDPILSADRRQRIAVCTMAVVSGFVIDAMIGPALPAVPLPGAWCLGLAIGGYLLAAGLLVCLWRIP